VATIIASEYSESKIVAPLAYGIATLTAWSRVNDNAHWYSDAFLGSAIGYYTAKSLLHLHDATRAKERRLSLVARMVDGNLALVINYQF
jgi:hypothetical protein